MIRFQKELEQGAIQFRDDLQFELKSEFIPNPSLTKNTYTQEFYFFVPSALQINKQTYTKEQFYRDQTNFIRYKTPEFTFQELISPDSSRSPLHRIEQMVQKKNSLENVAHVKSELKLFGNIFRSAMRNSVRQFVRVLEGENGNSFASRLTEFLINVKKTRKKFISTLELLFSHWSSPLLQKDFAYVDEFVSNTIEYYLTGLLNEGRNSSFEVFQQVDALICDFLREEKNYREEKYPSKELESEETILYRRGLFNKYVFDALFLTLSRIAPAQKYRHFIGAFAAGIAMLFYIAIFAWHVSDIVINSFAFISLTVLLYIIKDRVKEGVKNLYFKQAIRWFPDYSTEILTPDGSRRIGELRESFSLIDQKEVPNEFVKMRNTGFHTELGSFIRPENVIYYKKEVNLEIPPLSKKMRRNKLNTIFRFNIHRFLEKASNPYHSYVTLDFSNFSLVSKRVPKVYHLNIIMKTTYQKLNLKKKIDVKKFRLVIDKNGIKRVEHVKM